MDVIITGARVGVQPLEMFLRRSNGEFIFRSSTLIFFAAGYNGHGC